jgi:hypothetical protein
LDKNKLGKRTKKLEISDSFGIEVDPDDVDEDEQVQVQPLKSVDVCDPLE